MIDVHWSAIADRERAAIPDTEVRHLLCRARHDLQRFVRHSEEKDFFFSQFKSYRGVLHRIEPP